MTRPNMVLVTLLSLLLWVTLVVAQRPNIDGAGPDVNVNHPVNNAHQRPSSLSSRPKQPPVTPPKLGVYTSQGCFGSVPDNITSLRSTHNSPSWCYQECQQKGKNVMLLKSKWCHCADNYPAEAFAVPDAKCHVGCREDPDVACGGIGSFSVYNMGRELDVSFDPFTPEQRPAQEPLPGKITSQGCFSQLPSQFTLFTDTNMTPSMCHDKCKGRQFSAMLINGDKCYCARKYPTKQSLLPDERCNLPCPGKPLFVCGGPGAYSVFNLGRNLGVDHDSIIPSESNGQVIEQPQPLATSDKLVSQGCLKQLPKDAVRAPLRAASSGYFLKDCVIRCRFNYHTVAMLQGSECHCSNTYPPRAALENDDLCQIPCRGNPDQMCGGHSDMYTAYLTGLPPRIWHQIGAEYSPPRQIPFEEPMEGRMTSHGCYKSYSRTTVSRAMGGKSINTATTCSRMCKHYGKPVALTHEHKCFCADTYPMLSTVVADKRCNSPCPANPAEACGGRGRTLSVINTGLNVSVAYDEEEVKKPELPKLPFYGCFDDTPDSAKHIDHRSFNRQAHGDSCTYACAAEGYPVALRRGGDCLCALSYPPPSSRVNETMCWFECPSDAREMCGGPLVWNVYRTRLDWPIDDDLDDQSTSAVTRPWKCSHPVIQQVKKTASWVMSEGTIIVYRIAWVFYTVLEGVKQFVSYIVSPLRWMWDAVAEMMDL